MSAMVGTLVSTEGGALVRFGAFDGWIARRRPVSAGRRIHSKRFGRVHRRGHPCNRDDSIEPLNEIVGSFK